MSRNVIFGHNAAFVFPPIDCTCLAAAELEPYPRAVSILFVNEYRAELF